MGDAAPQIMRTPVVDLIAQVNRFTRAGQFGGVIYPLASGNLTPELCRTAIIIQQTRLLEAQAAITDSGTALAITKAAAGLADPVGYVSGNLAALTGSIAGYADLKGMPTASYAADGGDKAAQVSLPMMIALGAAAAGAVWFLTTRKR